MTTLRPTASLLNLEGFRFEELQITPVIEELPSPRNGEIDADFEVFIHPEKPERFAVSLTVSFLAPAHLEFDPRIVNLVRARALGFFRWQKPLETVPTQLAANGLAILYGFMRGTLGTATSWFDATAILPGVDFTQMLNERAAASARIAAPTGTPRNMADDGGNRAALVKKRRTARSTKK